VCLRYQVPSLAHDRYSIKDRDSGAGGGGGGGGGGGSGDGNYDFQKAKMQCLKERALSRWLSDHNSQVIEFPFI
jgi:hypothetical protein